MCRYSAQRARERVGSSDSYRPGLQTFPAMRAIHPHKWHRKKSVDSTNGLLPRLGMKSAGPTLSWGQAAALLGPHYQICLTVPWPAGKFGPADSFPAWILYSCYGTNPPEPERRRAKGYARRCTHVPFSRRARAASALSCGVARTRTCAAGRRHRGRQITATVREKS